MNVARCLERLDEAVDATRALGLPGKKLALSYLIWGRDNKGAASRTTASNRRFGAKHQKSSVLKD